MSTLTSGSAQSPIVLSDDDYEESRPQDASGSAAARRRRAKGKQRAVEPVQELEPRVTLGFVDLTADEEDDLSASENLALALTSDLPTLIGNVSVPVDSLDQPLLDTSVDDGLTELERADAELARKLALEEERAYIEAVQERDRQKLDEDQRVAQKLTEQEQKAYLKLMKTVEEKQEGIVFSVVVNVPSDTLEDGSPAHPDNLDRFSRWKEQFEKSAAGYQITKFHWFVNHELENRFNKARERLQDLGRPTEEVQLFHGTAAPNIDKIRQNGLKIGGTNGHQVVNGTAMGIGIYLAQNALTSVGYAAGCNRIFACRVLPGVTTSNMMNVRSVPNPELGTETYDSLVQNQIYVVRHTDLVLPCYMIEYTMPGAYNYAGAYGYPGAAYAYPPLPLPLPFPALNGAMPSLPYAPVGAPVLPPIVTANQALLRKPRGRASVRPNVVVPPPPMPDGVVQGRKRRTVEDVDEQGLALGKRRRGL